MAKKKRVDPIKQREKRAKIAAAVGGVLFLVVAAIEVPGIIKAFNPKPPPAPTHVSTATPADAGAGALPGSAPAAPAAGQLADTDVAPVSADGQLVSFSVFETKNPFRPQMTSASAGPGAAVAAPAGATTSAAKPGADVPPTTTGSGPATPAAPATIVPPAPTATVPATTTPATTTPAATTPTVAPQPTVAISVNGVVSHVASEGTFPSGRPVFRLVSFDGQTAEVGIVGGSYATGDATLTLHLKRPITLENTNDGKQYTLELVATR